MSPLTTDDLHRIFQKLDKNGDDHLSIQELNWLLERIGVNFALDELESSVGKSSLNFQEFVQFWDSITRRNEDGNGDDDDLDVGGEESDLLKAFNVFDANGDGFISSDELQNVLSRLGLWDEKTGKDCRSMICAYDTNLDGLLDFEEFKTMMFIQQPSS